MLLIFFINNLVIMRSQMLLCKKICLITLFLLMATFSFNASAARVFDISDKIRGSKDIEMDLIIDQMDISLEKDQIECKEEKFGKYTGSVEYDLRQRDLLYLSFSFSVVDIKIKEKEGNCRQFLSIWKDFYASKYPVISFISEEIIPKGKDKYEIRGKFDLQGWEEEITIEAEVYPTRKDRRIRIRSEFSVDIMSFRDEEETIFELWEPYWNRMTATFKLDLNAEN